MSGYARDKLYNGYLRRKMGCIASTVKVRQIIPHLPCLTSHDRDEIESKRATSGNYDAMKLLLACLMVRDNWPEEFISALEACEHTTLAVEMRQEYDSLRDQGNPNLPAPAEHVVTAHVHPPPPLSPSANQSVSIPESVDNNQEAVVPPPLAPSEPAAQVSPAPASAQPESQSDTPPNLATEASANTASSDPPPRAPQSPKMQAVYPQVTPPASPETTTTSPSPPPVHQEPEENSDVDLQVVSDEGIDGASEVSGASCEVTSDPEPPVEVHAVADTLRPPLASPEVSPPQSPPPQTDELPVEVTPEPGVDETPVEETRDPEPPVEVTPDPEPPVEETPDPPVDETPDTEPPFEETLEPKAPIEVTLDAPVEETPDTKLPVEDTPEPPVEETPEPPVDETPEPLVDETHDPEPSVEETPDPEPPVEETPDPEPPVEETPDPEPLIEETPDPEPPVEVHAVAATLQHHPVQSATLDVSPPKSPSPQTDLDETDESTCTIMTPEKCLVQDTSTPPEGKGAPTVLEPEEHSAPIAAQAIQNSLQSLHTDTTGTTTTIPAEGQNALLSDEDDVHDSTPGLLTNEELTTQVSAPAVACSGAPVVACSGAFLVHQVTPTPSPPAYQENGVVEELSIQNQDGQTQNANSSETQPVQNNSEPEIVNENPSSVSPEFSSHSCEDNQHEKVVGNGASMSEGPQLRNGQATSALTKELNSAPELAATAVTVSFNAASNDSCHPSESGAAGAAMELKPQNPMDKKPWSSMKSSHTKYFVTAAGVGACALLIAWKLKH